MDNENKLKIITLSDHNSSAGTWSVKDMLERSLEITKEHPEYKKAVVLFLDDNNNVYDTRMMCAGINENKDVISLLEIEKYRQWNNLDGVE